MKRTEQYHARPNLSDNTRAMLRLKSPISMTLLVLLMALPLHLRAARILIPFMVMGFEKARQKSSELKGIDVVFIYTDANQEIREYSSPKLQR